VESSVTEVRDAYAPQLERIRALSAGIRASTLERSPDFKARLLGLPAEEQISLLKAAVALMPAYRDGTAEDWVTGSLLYAAAVQLFSAKPPVTEADLCAMLTSARHDCGHGTDTQAPLDLVTDYMRRNGFSPRLGEAIAEFVANLPSYHSAQIQLARQRGNLLSVLAPWPPPTNGKPQPWIDTVGQRILATGDHERSLWQQLVLTMNFDGRYTLTARWRKVATPFVEQLGADHVLGRLHEFWPEADTRVCLERSGGQLFKYFLWLLWLLPREGGEPLARAVATMTWDRRKPPMAVLKPASAYLAESRSKDAARARAGIEEQIAAAGW